MTMHSRLIPLIGLCAFSGSSYAQHFVSAPVGEAGSWERAQAVVYGILALDTLPTDDRPEGNPAPDSNNIRWCRSKLTVNSVLRGTLPFKSPLSYVFGVRQGPCHNSSLLPGQRLGSPQVWLLRFDEKTARPPVDEGGFAYVYFVPPLMPRGRVLRAAELARRILSPTSRERSVTAYEDLFSATAGWACRTLGAVECSRSVCRLLSTAEFGRSEVVRHFARELGVVCRSEFP